MTTPIAMKHVGNAGDQPFTLTQVENGAEQSYVIPPAAGLDVPLSDAELAQQAADAKAASAAAQQTAAATLATAWIQLRMIRDRWLAQTDYIEVYLASANVFTPLPQTIQDAITANKDGWIAWRQQLRDLPAQPGLDPVAAVKAQPHASTQSPWPAFWPQPPAAPVIHFT